MLIWKGIDVAQKGIVVEHTPKVSKGKKKIQTYEVDGRNGFISIDTNTYEPFSISVQCHFKDTVNRDEICEYLDGYGTLSFDGERQYTAIIKNAIEFEKVMDFKKFPIQFLVNPIAEDIIPTTVLVSSNDFEFNITNTYYRVYPILEIECEGNISIAINNHTFYLNNTDDTYILDCKNKVIVDSNGDSASSLMLYDFPTLKKGTNEVSYTGTITNFQIKYRKTYL